MHALNCILFEYFDLNVENPWSLSLEKVIDSWRKGTIYGWKAENKNGKLADHALPIAPCVLGNALETSEEGRRAALAHNSDSNW